ncbi:hypothetical protein AVEN_18510-1 [Araneus ventricosus]|uniref:Uncharacterized protein n=1 Tax=Araneus ventricosus TaxID=182803 RepID=A0A4Y2JUB4_ARAVE|nr:hypothetical protein AVEN_18510-1 [Araneus ventricosus]
MIQKEEENEQQQSVLKYCNRLFAIGRWVTSQRGRIRSACYVSTVDNVEKSGKRELVYLQILTTNGFYAPLSLYPNDENTEDDWPEGMGLLPKVKLC